MTIKMQVAGPIEYS